MEGLPCNTTVAVYVHGWRQAYLRVMAVLTHIESLLGKIHRVDPKFAS
jgi:hypothetical protein